MVFSYWHVEILQCCKFLYTKQGASQSLNAMVHISRCLFKLLKMLNMSQHFVSLFQLQLQIAMRFLCLICPIPELRIVPRPPQSSWDYHLAGGAPLFLLHLTIHNMIIILTDKTTYNKSLFIQHSAQMAYFSIHFYTWYCCSPRGRS